MYFLSFLGENNELTQVALKDIDTIYSLYPSWEADINKSLTLCIFGIRILFFFSKHKTYKHSKAENA